MLIDRSLWKHAALMSGDSGFGPVLLRMGIPIRAIPVAGHNPDIDTPADLESLEAAETPST
jgi:CTP:molybdopterin cytidylyltransferase MocA